MNSVGNYTMVFREKTLTFGDRTFRAVLYGAYNAGGLIGTENNGIAVLDEDRMRVVLDLHCPQETGAFGPSDDQMVEWRRVCNMEASEFLEFCNSHPRLREPVDLESKVRRPKKFSVARLIKLAKTPIGYNPTLKSEFLNLGRQMMMRLASSLGLNEDQYEVRVNEGGIAVSGEVTLHTDRHYIQFCPSRIGGEGFLVRTCKGRKDYTGGRNHWVKWEDLKDLGRLSEFILSLS